MHIHTYIYIYKYINIYIYTYINPLDRYPTKPYGEPLPRAPRPRLKCCCWRPPDRSPAPAPPGAPRPGGRDGFPKWVMILSL